LLQTANEHCKATIRYLEIFVRQVINRSRRHK